MNRLEALRILGLDEDASADDIRIAYKESAQILHPDRFASNKKLQDRATEQFKTLQEAYETLNSKRSSSTSQRSSASRRGRAGSRGSAGSYGSAGVGSSAGSRASSRSYNASAADLEARLAGIAAARAQLVAQKDTVLDERKNAISMIAIGAAVALIAGRRPFGLFAAVAAIASAATVWGIVTVISAQKTLATLDEHIKELKSEQRRIKDMLEKQETEEA